MIDWNSGRGDFIFSDKNPPAIKLHFHDPRKVQDLTWQELAALRSPLANQRLITFEDLVARAKRANLRLMLDTKAPHSEKFPALIETILAKHGIRVVPTVNLFHYETRNADGTVHHERPAILRAARADIERLLGGGVTEFQIDSGFMDWFPH